MYCLGLVGGRDRVGESYFETSVAVAHDSAAVLVKDGEIVAAVEEERIDRIKHSNKFPVGAARACLKIGGIEFGQLDRIGYAWREDALDEQFAAKFMLHRRPRPFAPARTVFDRLFVEEFGSPSDGNLHFVPHHLAHAYSAFGCSGFDRSLVLCVDANGEDASGLVGVSQGNQFAIRKRFSREQSLGVFYHTAIGVIGYKLFDEYKVMGLAPYGDPARYRRFFGQLHELLDDGEFALRRLARAPDACRTLLELQRAKTDPIEQRHRDWCAALQETLENILFHVLTHHRAAGGCQRLALAGGVAHNCSANGKIRRSGLFDDVFVQPAAHDAGAALGAALWCDAQGDRGAERRSRLVSVGLGQDLGGNANIERELERWSSVVEWDRVEDGCAAGAAYLADGKVIGWVQGRSEFGPRALGSRSILADPRPAQNKERINAMVKKREAYRPFAPSVLEEEVHRYFDVPAGTQLPFMIFVVPVLESRRAELGAVTHVDGTARVQTVSKVHQPQYWRLIHRFFERTGIPVVLNTSFNNHAEPIVDGLVDALTCFLTTGLDVLVAGDFVIRKKELTARSLGGFTVRVPPHLVLSQRLVADECQFRIAFQSEDGGEGRVGDDVAEALLARQGRATVAELCASVRAPSAALQSILELWTDRLLVLEAG